MVAPMKSRLFHNCFLGALTLAIVSTVILAGWILWPQWQLHRLIAQLNADTPGGMRDVREDLTRLGPAAVPALVEMLKNEQEWPRERAAWTLGSIGPSAVPELLRLLNDKNPAYRLAAADTLGQIKPPVDAQVAPLIGLLNDYVSEVREKAMWSLGYIGSTGAPAVPALRTILREGDLRSRRVAADALCFIGPAAKDAIPDLIALLGHEDKELRRCAANALGGRSGPPDSVAARVGPVGMGLEAIVPLIMALGNESHEVRVEVIWALNGPLEYPGPQARYLIPKLLGLIDDAELLVRQHALVTLQSIDPSVVPQVRTILQEPRELPRD